MQDGFPPNFLDPSNLVIRNLKLRAATQDAPRTMVQQFGGGIERELAGNIVVSADVGRLVHRTPRGAAQPQSAAAGHARRQRRACRIPNFGNIQAREMNGEANYKGVDLSFEKRFSDGYSYRASYTHRRSARSGAGAPERVIGPRRRTRATSNRGKGRATSTSATASSPTSSPSCRSARASRCCRTASARQDPRRLAGERHLQRALGPAVHGDAGQQQRRRRSDRAAEPHRRSRRAPRRSSSGSIPAAFTQVPSGTFGNAGRNILRGPGWITFDMSVQRRIDFTEPRQRDVPRWDIFNVFNRANFGLPDGEHRRRQRRRDLDAGRRPARDAVVVEIWLLSSRGPGVFGSRASSSWSRCSLGAAACTLAALGQAKVMRSAFADTTFDGVGRRRVDRENHGRLRRRAPGTRPAARPCVLAITLDDRAPVHLPVVRSGDAEYRVMLGKIGPGRHTAKVMEEPNLTAASLRGQPTCLCDRGRSDTGHRAGLSSPLIGAVRLRAAGYGGPLHRCAGVDVVRDRAHRARHAVSLFRDLHERRRRHAGGSPDGHLGTHHRHRVRLQRRSRRERRHPQRRHAGAQARDPPVQGQARRAASAVVGEHREQHGAAIAARRRCATRRRPWPWI